MGRYELLGAASNSPSASNLKSSTKEFTLENGCKFAYVIISELQGGFTKGSISVSSGELSKLSSYSYTQSGYATAATYLYSLSDAEAGTIITIKGYNFSILVIGQ